MEGTKPLQASGNKVVGWVRRHPIISIVVGVVVLGQVINMLGESATPAPAPTQASDPAQPTLSAADAQSQLNDLMTKLKKTGLVSSYEFDEQGQVVYVSDSWYGLDVSNKKSFLSTVSTLKNIAQGKQWFEVRDDHSNEKVAEVTAFSGALEIYQ